MAENEKKEIEDSTSGYVDRGTPMLTTFDNPFNPFTQFTEWNLYDVLNHHNCCAYIDRMAHTSPELTPSENNEEIEGAIDQLIEADFLHIYRKVFFDDFETNT